MRVIKLYLLKNHQTFQGQIHISFSMNLFSNIYLLKITAVTETNILAVTRTDDYNTCVNYLAYNIRSLLNSVDFLISNKT